MKTLTEFINEQLEIVEIVAESEINSESDFRKYAEDKFKEEFGDELDVEKMNTAIDNIISNYKEGDDWDKLVGMIDKLFVE